MSKLKNRFMKRLMAMVLSGAMVLSNMSVSAAELVTEETVETVSEAEETNETVQIENAAGEESAGSVSEGKTEETVETTETTGTVEASSEIETATEEKTTTVEETTAEEKSTTEEKSTAAEEATAEETTTASEETTTAEEMTSTEETMTEEETAAEEETTGDEILKEDAQIQEYEFDVAEMGVIADFSTEEVKTFTSKNGYFTVYYGDKGKVDTNSKTFPDGYKNTHRLTLNGASVTPGNPKGVVGFTTTQNDAKAKVWWRCQGDGRTVAIYDANGTKIDAEEPQKKDTYKITTFTLTTAGTYYIGNDGDNNWLSKFSVKEGKEDPIAWSQVAAPEITNAVQNSGKIDVTVKAVIDEIEGADGIDVEMYDSDKKLIATEKSAKATKESTTVSFTPTASGAYTFIAKAYREAEENNPHASAESDPVNFVLPLKAPTSFSGKNMGGGDIEIGYGEVPEADSYVVSAVEAEETIESDGKVTYQPKAGAEPITQNSDTLKAKFTGLKLDTNYIFQAYAVRKGTGAEGTDEKGPVSEAFVYKILDRSEYAWTYRAFGQSANVKYNGYKGNANDGELLLWSGMHPQEEGSGGTMQKAGKLASDGHLGVSFYYVPLEPDDNFVLEATAKVNWWYWGGGETFALVAADAVGEHGDGSVYYDNLYGVGTADLKYWWNGSSVDPEDNYDPADMRYRMSNGMAAIIRGGVTKGWDEGGASAPSGLINLNTTLETSAASSGRGAGTYNMIGNYVDEKGNFGGPAPNKGTDLTDYDKLQTEFKLRLEKDNTGYHMTWIDAEGKEHTHIEYDRAIFDKEYDKSTLLQLDKDYIYVGFMAARDMNVTFSDIKLTTSKVDYSVQPEDKPKSYRSAAYSVASGTVANKPDYDVIFTTNWEGTLSVKDAAGRELVNKEYFKYLSENQTQYLDKTTGTYKTTSLLEKYFDVGTKGEDGRYSKAKYDEAGNIVSANVRADSTKIVVPINENVNKDSMLSIGKNQFQVTFTPDQNWHINDDENCLLTDYNSWIYDLSVTYGKYGDEGNNIYVAPSGTKQDTGNIVKGVEGKPSGDGTKEAPLDIYTAVKYVQPGQTIVLAKGRYSLKTPITVTKGVDGKEGKMIYMVAEPGSYDRTQPFKAGGVVLDFNGVCTGMTINGSYWYLKGFDITNTADKQKGLQISGSHNVVDQVNTYYNGNTGIQIARGNAADNDITDWPSYNLVKNCTSFNNADSDYEDADGFAAKLTIGMGNVFDGCISAYNADDGWDFYAKGISGPIGQVVIKNSITFRNGYALKDENGKLDIFNGKPTGTGNGNGFKMGGESISGHHILLNSYAFENKAKGIDNNSCPDVQAYNSISFNNESRNVSLEAKSATENTDFRVWNVISYRTKGDAVDAANDLKGTQNKGDVLNRTFYLDGKNADGKTVDETWFEKLDFVFEITAADGSQSEQSTIARNSDGTIKINNGFLQLTEKGRTEAGFVNLKESTLSANVGTVKVYVPVEDGSEGDIKGGAVVEGTPSEDVKVEDGNDTSGEISKGDEDTESGTLWSDEELAIIDTTIDKYTVLLDLDSEALDANGYYHIAYTGMAVKPNVRVAKGNGEGILPSEVDASNYSLTYKNNKLAYPYSPKDSQFDAKKAPAVIMKGKGNYIGTYPVYFIIDRIRLDDSSKVANTGLVTLETGKSIALPKLMYNGKALSEKEYDYKNAEIKDANGTKVNEIKGKGSYTVTYKALDLNFTGMVTSNVRVLSADEVANMTDISKLKTEKIANVTYNGKPYTPAVQFKDGKSANDVCSVQYVGNTDAGTASVILTGNMEKNYYGTKTVTFNIMSKSLNLNDYSITARHNGKDIVFDKEHKKYDEPIDSNGSSVSLNGVQVWVGAAKSGEEPLKEGVDYKISYSGVRKAGTGSIIIKGLGNYKGSMRGSFKIEPHDITSDSNFTVQISDQPYAKNFKAPTIILKKGNTVISSDNYTVTCTKKVLGESVATVTGKNLLKGKRTDIPFKIVEKEMSAAVISAPNVYNGGSVKAKGNQIPYITKAAVLDNNKKMALNKDYTLEYYKADQFDKALFDEASGTAYYKDTATGEKKQGTPLGKNEKIDFTGASQTIYVVAKAVEGSGYKGAAYTSYSLVGKNTLNRLKVEKLDTPIGYKEGETANVLIGRIMGQYVSEGKLKIQNKKFSEDGQYVNEDSLTLLTANDYEIDYSKSKYKNGKATIVINGKGDYAGTKKISVKVELYDLSSGWNK